eukprot:356543-Chlamydomonas_euryale.AAC.17
MESDAWTWNECEKGRERRGKAGAACSGMCRAMAGRKRFVQPNGSFLLATALAQGSEQSCTCAKTESTMASRSMRLAAETVIVRPMSSSSAERSERLLACACRGQAAM